MLLIVEAECGGLGASRVHVACCYCQFTLICKQDSRGGLLTSSCRVVVMRYPRHGNAVRLPAGK